MNAGLALREVQRRSRRLRGAWCMMGICAVLLVCGSCGEDRTYEYDEKTARDHWMLDAMREYYLWGDSIRDSRLAWKDYFAAPATFFAKLTAQAPVKDVWSWCAIDTLNEDHHQRGHFNHIDSYGLDFTLMTDPTGATSRQYARVTTVYAGSPAERCGIERGDFIGMVDGNRMTSSYAANLENGKQRTIVRSRLAVNAELQEFVWASEDTLTMERSERVPDAAFSAVRRFDLGNDVVAYLQCNTLSGDADAIGNVMRQVEATQASVFVLDLRLCNDGTMEAAQMLASYLIDEPNAGQVFARTIYSTRHADRNTTFGFVASAVARNLSIRCLYVITSSYTSGAAEWLIRGLQHVEAEGFVVTVGTATAGQIVMTEPVAGPAYHVTIHPAVAYVANGAGDYDYAGGIDPDVAINELEYVSLFPYGDERETVLAAILMQIVNE